MQPKPEPKHTHAHQTPQPGVAGYKRGAHTNTQIDQHSSQEWRGTAETRAQAHTPKPHTPARSGGEQAEHAHEHTHTPTPQPPVAGRSRKPTAGTHTHTTHTTLRAHLDQVLQTVVFPGLTRLNSEGARLDR